MQTETGISAHDDPSVVCDLDCWLCHADGVCRDDCDYCTDLEDEGTKQVGCIAPRVKDDRTESGFAQICYCHVDPHPVGHVCSSCGCRTVRS